MEGEQCLGWLVRESVQINTCLLVKSFFPFDILQMGHITAHIPACFTRNKVSRIQQMDKILFDQLSANATKP